MARPPADADPEKFIIGKGWYCNMQTTTSFYDGVEFRFDPAPMPIWWIVILNIVYVAFFFGIHWVVKHGQAGPWAVYGAPIGIGLTTCSVVTLFIYCSYDRARRLGPWMSFDTSTGRVTLPRDGMSFERDEIVHLQYITTKILQSGGEGRFSELNLITCRGGEQKRWPLLRSNATIWAFDRLLKPLLQHTDLPVVRVTDESWGWKVTEIPYG